MVAGKEPSRPGRGFLVAEIWRVTYGCRFVLKGVRELWRLLAGRLGAVFQQPLVAVAADAVYALLAGGGFAHFVAESVFRVPLLALGDAHRHVVVHFFVPLELEHLAGLLVGRAHALLVEVVDAGGGDLFRAVRHFDPLVAQENERYSFGAVTVLQAGSRQHGKAECEYA